MHLDEKDASVVKRSRTMGRRPEVGALCLARPSIILIYGFSVIVAETGGSNKA
ncbi:MAG: hypothetical protein OEZ25_01485 [Candidatus Bathyarchaeota archaeon]|nr:hypothetical protein [Candidatus Bathyarchaeota archaeon]